MYSAHAAIRRSVGLRAFPKKGDGRFGWCMTMLRVLVVFYGVPHRREGVQ